MSTKKEDIQLQKKKRIQQSFTAQNIIGEGPKEHIILQITLSCNLDLPLKNQ